MTLHHNFRKNKKGISSIFGMVFFLLIVIIVMASFLVVLNQSTSLEQTIVQSNQMSNDANREQVRIFTTPGNNQFFTNIGANSATISCEVNNTGTISIQLVRLWIEDQTTGTSNSTPVSYVIQAGQVITVPPTTVNLAISNTGSDNVIFWFATARGNNFNQYTNQGPPGPQGPQSIRALVSQGIGSISFYFDSFAYYNVNTAASNVSTISPYPNGYIGYTAPELTSMAFGVNVTNYSPSGYNITLDPSSLMWSYFPAVPGQAVGPIWTLAANQTNTLTPGLPITLQWGKPQTIIFFNTGIKWQNSQIGLSATNLIFYGNYTTTSNGVTKVIQSYGQNIPFVGINFT